MEFKQSVMEALAYYVYALVDSRDNKIFYIGKGKGNRVFQHAEACIEENTYNLKPVTILSVVVVLLDIFYNWFIDNEPI